MQARDEAYEGVFLIAVKTTGIFCRPGCPARMPKAENVTFFATAKAAAAAGYRACLRCKPLTPKGAEPAWLAPLLADLARDPETRIDDQLLKTRGIAPHQARRWFKAQHGMTLHAFLRARRLAEARRAITLGHAMTDTAFASGFESLSGFRDAFRKLYGETPGRAGNGAVLYVTRYLTQLGPLIAAASDKGLAMLEFADPKRLARQVSSLQKLTGARAVPDRNSVLDTLERELTAYFEGRGEGFSVPLDPQGTEFQKAVWRALTEVPYGATQSYAGIAQRIGKPSAMRAVGLANGANKIAIVIPCHRVIGANGTLTGYGGGLWRKRFLLDLEARARGEAPGRAEAAPRQAVLL